MERDLVTFLTALSVIVDDFYQRHIVPQLPACGGLAAQRSESEVRCVGLAVHWRSGVPGKCTRGIMRYRCKPLRHLFPTVLTPSACNRRLRRLWGVCSSKRRWPSRWGTRALLRSWMAVPSPSPTAPGRSSPAGEPTSRGSAQEAMTAISPVCG